MELKPHIRKIGAYLLLWVSTGVALALLFWQIDRSYNETRRLLEKNLLGEAIAHFETLVVARVERLLRRTLRALSRSGTQSLSA
ncbi:MAG: hypothetical protein IE916_09020 [Epsilonproteobacteria bacterium]|nr:hypothetical protein [Campylobacterota bacterium]